VRYSWHGYVHRLRLHPWVTLYRPFSPATLPLAGLHLRLPPGSINATYDSSTLDHTDMYSARLSIEASGLTQPAVNPCWLRYVWNLHILHQITYYSWVAGLWTYPEMTSEIIAACLPVSPKFFQRLGQTWLYSRIKSSINYVLKLTIHTNRRSIDDPLTGRQRISPGSIARNARERPKLHQTLPNDQLLLCSSEGSVDRILMGEEPSHPDSYIMRTIGINVDSNALHVSQPGGRDGSVSAWPEGS